METDQGYERDGWRAINTALGLTAIRVSSLWRLRAQLAINAQLEEMARPALRTVFCDSGAGCRRRHECRHQAEKRRARHRVPARRPRPGSRQRVGTPRAGLTATAESGER
jgi:hypothetical protein